MLPGMYFQMFSQIKKGLTQLNTWLDAAEKHAADKKFDSSVFLTERVIADQFAFARQVQITCDTAKLGASRLTGKEAPSHEDTEKTLGELKARVSSTIAYLNTFTEADFAKTAERSITQPRWEGKTMTGNDYFFEHVVPNFFFHATHVYAILRKNGVPVGKRDFLGPLTQRLPS